jgi:hypothetical protein
MQKTPQGSSLRRLPRSASLCFGSGVECGFDVGELCRAATLRAGSSLLVLLLSTQPNFAQQYQTLGPNSCGTSQNNCHVKENSWWTNDDHYTTADPFFDATGKYAKIAKLYGMSIDDIAKGNHKCMECHGTVVSAAATREVDFGVSCESCHGPGSGYKDVHSEKGGYPKALKLGMLEVKNLDTRAMMCVRCHCVTEQKLVSAGHPAGEDFDYVGGIRKKIAKHWKHPAESVNQLEPVFAKAAASKGPVRQMVSAERTEPKPAPNRDMPMEEDMPMQTPRAAEPMPAMPAMGTNTQPVAMAQPARMMEMPPRNVAQLILPPFPAIKDTMSVEQILMIIKKRLELLQQMTEGR